MPAKTIVDADDLKSLAVALLTESGLAPAHAEAIAEVSIWAALRGVDSHGVPRIAAYLDLLADGVANPKPDLKVVSNTPAAALIDADRAPGPVALTLAADEAVARAKANGTGTAAVRRTVHTGAIGYYTSRIADVGLIGVAFVAGMPQMPYPGVKGAALATSPLSIAVPSTGEPVLLDMATATIALGRIKQYKNAGEAIPEGAAATAEGVPTTDPALAAMPLPLGGAKGAGMSLMFELLTSVLVGEPIVSAVHGGAPKQHRQNALIMALDPAAFGNAEVFPGEVGATVEALKQLPRLEEGTTRVPGERGAATAAERTAEGIPVAPKVWSQLVEAAERLGVSVPGTA